MRKKYPSVIKSWYNNFEEITNFLKLPYEYRKMIYTTNAIESLNKLIRQKIKTKGGLHSTQYASKVIFCVIEKMTEKWKKQLKNWSTIFEQLKIIHPGRCGFEKMY